MDFNNQRRIVKKLREKGKNPLLFLPCLIASYLVIIFMTLGRAVDMALSDKNGNFLGIKRKPRRARKIQEVPVPVQESRLEARKNRRLRYSLPYRSFAQRVGAFGMAAAFTMMLVPDALVGAVSVNNGKITLDAMQMITSADLPAGPDKSGVTEADLETNYRNHPDLALVIGEGAFNGFRSLTTVTLGYCEADSIGKNNFINIAPDASAFVNASNEADFKKQANRISAVSKEITPVWNMGGMAYKEIPADIPLLDANNGVGSVILEWKHINNADGYRIYSYTNGVYAPVSGNIAASSVYDANATNCKYELKTSVKNPTRFAIRAYRNISLDYNADGKNDVNTPIYSIKFTEAANNTMPLTAGSPSIEVNMVNKTANVTISTDSKASEPSYIVLFCRDEGETAFSPRERILASDLKNGVFTYPDPVPFKGEGIRSYIAVAYYDVFNKFGVLTTPQIPYSEKDEKTPEFTTTRSKKVDVTEVVLGSPTNLTVDPSTDKTMWVLKWDPPADSDDLGVKYRISANGRYITEAPVNYVKIPINHPDIVQGEDVTFSVTAAADGMTSGKPAEYTVKVSQSCVTLNKVIGGNGRATVNFKEYAGTNVYTIYFTHLDSTGVERTDYKKVSKSDCRVTGGNLEYVVTGLSNDVEYTFWVESDAMSADYPSVKKKVTPSEAPQPPLVVRVSTFEKGAEINWDIVYKDGTEEPVEGYYIEIKRKSGQTVLAKTPVVGNNTYTATNLENDVEYYAYVSSYVVVNDDPPIESVTATRSDVFMPTVKVDTVPTLSAVPDGRTIKLTWSTVQNATKYIVTRTDGTNSVTWDMGNKTGYVDTEIFNNVEYTYTVRAVRVVDNKTYEGADSSPQRARVNIVLGSVQDLTTTGANGSITLKWTAVKDAEGYYVEYLDETTGNWIRLAKVSGTAYTDQELPKGTKRRYRVLPYTTMNGQEVGGDPAYAQNVSGTEGIHLPAPLDFTATAGEGQVTLKWTAVKGADGYAVYIVDSNGNEHLLDRVSKTTAIHTNISNGHTITYKVCAFRYDVNGIPDNGEFSPQRTVTVGIIINAPTDLVVTPGDTLNTLKWKGTAGAEGYVVYCYNMSSMTFTPVGIVTSAAFAHTGLINGREYTYMIAAYKNVDGSPVYSPYSLAVSGTPVASDKGNSGGSSNSKPNSTGSNSSNKNPDPSEFRIYITGTTPYGMSNSNLISAYAEKGAISSDIDVRFTLNPDSVSRLQNVLNYYGTGVDSFIYYPMDIALYVSGTDTRAYLNAGYYLTLTIPVPDDLLPYSDKISVVHISDNDQLEILPSIPVNVGGVNCIQFTAQSFSTYAFVVYLPYYAEDTSAGTAASGEGSAETQTGSTFTFRCTSLPDIYRRRVRNKVYRVVTR